MKELCAACSMCCNGTLYLYVTLTNDDVRRLEKYPQLALTTKNEQPSFSEPCVFHGASGCSVYADRPDACRRYSCALLSAVQHDEVSVDDAKLIIEEALARVEIVKEYVAFEPGMPLAIGTWDEPPDEVQGEARVAWDRVLWHIREHFLGPQPEHPKTT